MARDRYEDEDDEDRPRRRRRNEDDEEEEGRPRRKRRRSREPEPKSHTGLIIGIVAGVILLVVMGCGVAGFFTFKKARDAFQAQDAADEASAAGIDFFEKISSEQTGQAYAATTPAFRNSYPETAFADLLKKHPLLTQHKIADEQGYGMVPVGKAPNRTYTSTYLLSDVDPDDVVVDEDEGPRMPKTRPKPKKQKPIAKTLTVKIVVQEGPQDVWKVDSLVISP